MECANAAKMLRLDFRRSMGVLSGMDDDTRDLVAQLCTRIGMIMEDASVDALTMRRRDREQLIAAIDKLAMTGEHIAALVRAARALLE